MLQRLAKRTIGTLVSTTTRKRLRYAYATLHGLAGKDYFPANNALDKQLLPYLADVRNGIFIEAGANDGLAQSNTWHLEKRLGWRGLLVEPIPHMARLCQEFRKNSVVENCALGSFEQDGEVVELQFGGLMTVADGADLAHMEGGSTESHAREGAGWTGDKPYRFKSTLHPLTTLLLRNGFERADLLSLDVEGFEVPALAGLDPARTPVTFVLVETSNLPAVQAALGERYALIAQLSIHDYLFKLTGQ